jgi:hypothetical protein
VKKKEKPVHPIFLALDVVEAVRRIAEKNRRTMKAEAEMLIRESIEARVKAAAEVAP